MTGQQTHTANAQQSYTLTSRTSPISDHSLPKSMPAPTQDKIQNIFSYPSKKIKTPNTQAVTTKTVKLNNDNGLQAQWTRTTGYNKQFGKSTADVVNSTFVLLSTLVLNLNFSISEPCLRQAAGRCHRLNIENRKIDSKTGTI